MRTPPELLARREREYAAAATAADVAALHQRWHAEDRAIEAAADWRAKRIEEQAHEISDLRRRVKALEAAFRAMPREIGTAIGKTVAKGLQEHPGMRYAGTYDPAKGYLAGSVVTAQTGMWIATAVAPAGEKPGKSAAWRLVMKGRIDEGSNA